LLVSLQGRLSTPASRKRRWCWECHSTGFREALLAGSALWLPFGGCGRKEGVVRSVMIGLCVALYGAVLSGEMTSPAAEDQRLSSAATELVRSQISPEMIEQTCTERAEALSTFLQVGLRQTLKRDLSDDEKQRLHLFVLRKLKELMDYTVLEHQL